MSWLPVYIPSSPGKDPCSGGEEQFQKLSVTSAPCKELQNDFLIADFTQSVYTAEKHPAYQNTAKTCLMLNVHRGQFT